MKGKIIDYIKTNRVSTTEVADCLDKNKNYTLRGISALNRNHFAVGNVFWGYAYAESNWMVHEQVQNVQEGDIVFIETFDCEDRAIFGDLVSKYLILYKQAKGIVVNGFLRDAPRLIKENWPIWCTGLTPIGCFNEKPTNSLNEEIINEHKQRYTNSVAVCDDCGVVIIPNQYLNQSFLERLIFIEQQEDKWYECIDRKKWSTFDTVCLKKYDNGQLTN